MLRDLGAVSHEVRVGHGVGVQGAPVDGGGEVEPVLRPGLDAAPEATAAAAAPVAAVSDLVAAGILVRVAHHGLLDDLVGGFLFSAAEQLLEGDDSGQHEGQLADDERLTGEEGEGLVGESDHETLHHQPDQQRAGILLLLSPAC